MRVKPQEGREEDREGDEGRRAWPVIGLITFDYLCYQRGHVKCYRTIETLALRQVPVSHFPLGGKWAQSVREINKYFQACR